jgi:uncharacterized membrane protein
VLRTVNDQPALWNAILPSELCAAGGVGSPRIGSRSEVHWKIGSAPVGGIIEVVEFDEAGDLAWVSITGVNLRGRFRLRDAGPDGTRVTFRLSYQAPGGLLGLIADRIAARQVGRELQQSLANVRAMVEP